MNSAAPRLIIVGDVHGCIDELRALLRKCNHRAGVDRLVFVGDLVGKGPDSYACVKLARSLRAECVKGNWDHFVVSTPKFIENDYKRGHPDTKEVPSLSEDDWQWLRDLPYTIDIPEHNILVVHAGLVPRVPIDQQKPEDMMNMRNLLPDGTATADIKLGTAWAKSWPGPRVVVFGHDAQRFFQREKFAIGLDTGAVYGRHLTAYVMPQQQVIQVASAKVYSDPGPKGKSMSALQRLRHWYRRYDPSGAHLPLLRAFLRMMLVLLLIRLLWTVVSRLPD